METHDLAYLEHLMDDMDGLQLPKGRGNRKRKTSVVVKSLRKISSTTDNIRSDPIVIVENDAETRLWRQEISGF